MKLTILGATGQTGQCLVSQALQQGHQVTALVRNVSKMKIQHKNLKVVETNIFSADSLLEHFEGQDAIVSCLGFPFQLFSSISGYTNSMSEIVKAMRVARVDRIVLMTAWHTDLNFGPLGWRVLIVPLYKGILGNMYAMENYLEKECSDLNWTVVRAPGLQNVPVTDKEFVTYEGYSVPGEDGTSKVISRGDVARFMLSLLESNEWTRKGVAMCTK